MQVKLLIARAAATGSQNRGDVVEVSDAEAVRMFEADQAEPVRTAKATEKAVKRSKHERASK